MLFTDDEATLASSKGRPFLLHLLAVMACVRWLRDSLERSFLEEDRWCRWLCSLRPEGEDLWRDARWPLAELFLLPCRCDGDRLRDREETLRLRLCEPCRLELSLDSRPPLSSSLDLMGELSADPASL